MNDDRFQKAMRVIRAFEAFRSGVLSAVDTDQSAEDLDWLRERYEARKWKVGFREANERAKAEFMLMVLDGNE